MATMGPPGSGPVRGYEEIKAEIADLQAIIMNDNASEKDKEQANIDVIFQFNHPNHFFLILFFSFSLKERWTNWKRQANSNKKRERLQKNGELRMNHSTSNSIPRIYVTYSSFSELHSRRFMPNLNRNLKEMRKHSETDAKNHQNCCWFCYHKSPFWKNMPPSFTNTPFHSVCKRLELSATTCQNSDQIKLHKSSSWKRWKTRSEKNRRENLCQNPNHLALSENGLPKRRLVVEAEAEVDSLQNCCPKQTNLTERAIRCPCSV